MSIGFFGKNDVKEFKVKIVKPRISKFCKCPFCGMKQQFKKEKEHWKIVKDVDLDRPVLLKVRVVYAKCLNPKCPYKSFQLPIPDISKYAKATNRLKSESIAGIVEDNSTCPRIAKRLNRSFNTTASRTTIDRWKHKEAEKYGFKEIIAKIGFSGILTVDEYKPKRSKTYDLIAGDAIKNKIFYISAIPLFFGRGHIEKFFRHLKVLGIEPWAIIFDLLTAFPKQAKKVWPEILIQFDYFHVMQWIHRYFKNAILRYRQELKKQGGENKRAELWEHKWRLLKNMDNWTLKDHRIISSLIEDYSGTIVEDILIFKQYLYEIFDNSETRKEAYCKRDSLHSETWWQHSWHLRQVMKFLASWKFKYMITYLDHPEIPRTGNSEELIRIWRQMEKVRYGFKTEKGRQDHLKLFQISKYLGGKIN